MLIAAKTDTGKVRKANEDSYSVCEGKMTYIIVADGMGGLKAGKTASATAVQAAEKFLTEKNKAKHMNIPAFLSAALDSANAEVYHLTKNDPNGERLGTTFVMAYVENNIAYIANIGDSRAYLISKGKISQITVDHSLVQNLYERGEIKRSEMRTHPQKNIITRAIGTDERVECDVFEVELSDGDLILLCSDGLCNMIEDERILDIHNTHTELGDFAVELVNAANEAGGYDNITVAVLKF